MDCLVGAFFTYGRTICVSSAGLASTSSFRALGIHVDSHLRSVGSGRVGTVTSCQRWRNESIAVQPTFHQGDRPVVYRLFHNRREGVDDVSGYVLQLDVQIVVWVWPQLCVNR